MVMLAKAGACFYRVAFCLALAAFLQGCEDSPPGPSVQDSNATVQTSTTQAPTTQTSTTQMFTTQTSTTTLANTMDALSRADHDVHGRLVFLTQNCKVYTNNMENAKTALRRTLANVTNQSQDSIWVGQLTCQNKSGGSRLRRLGQDELLDAPYSVRTAEMKSSAEVDSAIQDYPSQKLHERLAEKMGEVSLPPPRLHRRASMQSAENKPGLPCAHHSGETDNWALLAGNGFGLGSQYKNTQTMEELRIDTENFPDGSSIVFGCIDPWTYSGGLEKATLKCLNGKWQLANADAFGECKKDDKPAAPQCKAGHLSTGYTFDFYAPCVGFLCTPVHPVTNYHKNWLPAADCDMTRTGGSCEINPGGQPSFATNGDMSYPVGEVEGWCFTAGGQDLRYCTRC